VVDDADDARLAADALAAPGEAAGVEAKGAELAVAAAGADEVDALGANARVGGLAALLESSAGRRRWSVILCVRMAFRVMAHTASYGNVRVWRRSRRVYGGNRVRYWHVWSAIVRRVGGYLRIPHAEVIELCLTDVLAGHHMGAKLGAAKCFFTYCECSNLKMDGEGVRGGDMRSGGLDFGEQRQLVEFLCAGKRR
jgi:hypothetical protein